MPSTGSMNQVRAPSTTPPSSPINPSSGRWPAAGRRSAARRRDQPRTPRRRSRSWFGLHADVQHVGCQSPGGLYEFGGQREVVHSVQLSQRATVASAKGGATFERFTDSARRVVGMAEEASRRLGHDYIGTGHLSVGLTDAPNIAAIFMSAGLAPSAIEDELRRRRPTDPTMAAKGHIPFTAGVERAFELSRLESQRLGHGQIGPAHLLLGLLDEQCLALEIVTALDVDHFELRGPPASRPDSTPRRRPGPPRRPRAGRPRPNPHGPPSPEPSCDPPGGRYAAPPRRRTTTTTRSRLANCR